MKATIQRALCLVLTLCLLSAALASCAAKTEEVYLNSFTRVFDGSNNLLDLRSYTYNEYGQLLTYTAEDRKVTHTYDGNGNLLTTRTETLKDGRPVSVEETRMTYDGRGNMVTTDSYRINGDTETHLGGLTLEYDQEDRLLRETGSQTVTEYVYTQNGGYTSTETLTAEKRVVCIITVEKNSAGQVTSRVTDRKDTGNTESYTATYSEAGDLLTERYTMNGAELESYRYEYDTHGDHTHLARAITLQGETELERTVYGYDENHNRTQGVVCSPNGTVLRTYIYEYVLTEVKRLPR